MVTPWGLGHHGHTSGLYCGFHCLSAGQQAEAGGLGASLYLQAKSSTLTTDV